MAHSRSDYLNAVSQSLEKNIFYHSLALEACMGGIYKYLVSQGQLHPENQDIEDWLLAGLIHDIDYTPPFKQDHPNKTKEALAAYGLSVSDHIDSIIKAHAPDLTGQHPQSQAQWAIYCADSLTGLIVATALVYPDKKLSSVKTSSVLKRFLKEPRFAAGTRREEVAKCQLPDTLNIPLEKFIDICLSSMQQISSDIGL